MVIQSLLATGIMSFTSLLGPCPGDGGCCMANGTPGCDDAECCETICAIDPFCCDTAWDLFCADQAGNLCGACFSCIGDISGDGEIDGADVAQVLASWGDCPPPPADCPADLNDDDIVNGIDLAIVLRNWGPCGSCCLTDGTCDVLPEKDCFALGGVFNAGLTCAEVTCEQPPGACCLSDGTCVELTEQECEVQGGLYEGDLTTCADTSCPQPPGACCLSDGSCVELTEQECEDQGGLFQGTLTACADVDCFPAEGDCCENGKPRVLTMLYTGDDCSATSHTQDPGKVSCEDFGPLEATVEILATDDEDPFDGGAKVWFSGPVSLNETFDLDAANEGDDKLATETFIHIFSVTGDLLQSVEFHTSCSQPLEIGNQFGASRLVDCEGEDEPIEGDCCANGKPRVLTMLYTGDDCSATSHAQDPGKVSCEDFGPLEATVEILATDDEDPFDGGAKVWFSGPVSLNETFDLDAANEGDDKLATETFIHIFSVTGELLQSVEFHTSCSQPLFVGNQFGASLLVDCIGEDEPIEGDCCDDDAGKPRVLTMVYTGDDCTATSHTQDPDKVSCEDFGPLETTVEILATNKEDPFDGGAKVWFSGPVSLNETFDLDAANEGDDKLASETFIHIFSVTGQLLQSVEFHTSCSQPLFIGNQFGASLLVDCIGEDE